MDAEEDGVEDIVITYRLLEYCSQGRSRCQSKRLKRDENEEWFVQHYQPTGKKLDMGKSCVRFKELEELDLKPLPALSWQNIFGFTRLQGGKSNP